MPQVLGNERFQFSAVIYILTQESLSGKQSMSTRITKTTDFFLSEGCCRRRTSEETQHLLLLFMETVSCGDLSKPSTRTQLLSLQFLKFRAQ